MKNGFRDAEQELEVQSMVRGFRIKGRRYGVMIKGSGARIGESEIRYYKQRYFDQRVLFDY